MGGEDIMKVIFDIDGTLTDYNTFVKKTAIPYFTKSYGWNVVNPNALEIEDVFEIKQRLFQNNENEETIKQFREIMDRFWISHRFLKFTLLTRFRPHARKVIYDFRKKGYKVECWTSRQKSTEKNIVGMLVRIFSTLQFYVNGVITSYKSIHFFRDDVEKLEAILEERPIFIFDDKPVIIEKLNRQKIRVICMAGTHNEKVENINRINSFESNYFENTMKKVYGHKNLDMMDNLAVSGKFYKNLLRFRYFLLNRNTEIQILNEHNIVKNVVGGIIYASNHRSTLDPLHIKSYLNKEIHWVALKRFFDGEDNIFNNSKNRILCKITQYCFRQLYFFPIERKKDNQNANNYMTVKAMNICLRVGVCVGIFPEGTTTRGVEDDFNVFDPVLLH